VQPQLGLLKSTMLQLDPAFSERDYGTNYFSTFVEKLVAEGFLAVKTVDGHYVVERKERTGEGEVEPARTHDDAMAVLKDVLSANVDILAMGIPGREIKALVQAADPAFRQTDYGFSEFAELLNYAADKGLVRAEPDPSQGLRYYPGGELPDAAGNVLEGRISEEEAAHTKTAPAPEAAETRPARGRRPRSRRGRRRPEGMARAKAADENQTAAGDEPTDDFGEHDGDESDAPATERGAEPGDIRRAGRRRYAPSRRGPRPILSGLSGPSDAHNEEAESVDAPEPVPADS
jgi:hypothetical protein